MLGRDLSTVASSGLSRAGKFSGAAAGLTSNRDLGLFLSRGSQGLDIGSLPRNSLGSQLSEQEPSSMLHGSQDSAVSFESVAQRLDQGLSRTVARQPGWWRRPGSGSVLLMD
jgi:hypothetical protein